MRVTFLLTTTLAVGAAGCSKPHEPQPSPAEVQQAAGHIQEQENALARAEAEERGENVSEALNEIDRNVQNARVP